MTDSSPFQIPGATIFVLQIIYTRALTLEAHKWLTPFRRSPFRPLGPSFAVIVADFSPLPEQSLTIPFSASPRFSCSRVIYCTSAVLCIILAFVIRRNTSPAARAPDHLNRLKQLHGQLSGRQAMSSNTGSMRRDYENIVVLGASYVGLAAAKELSELADAAAAETKGPRYRVVLVEQHSHFGHSFVW